MLSLVQVKENCLAIYLHFLHAKLHWKDLEHFTGGPFGSNHLCTCTGQYHVVEKPTCQHKFSFRYKFNLPFQFELNLLS